MLSARTASKKPRAWQSSSKTRVRDTSIWRMDSSHQNPASRSVGVSGSGSLAIHRSNHTFTVPAVKVSQMACSVAGSSQAANPLDSSVKASPAACAWRLARSCPLSQTLIG
jgi:hypothetical protein